MKRLESLLEHAIFGSRWLPAPFFIGLIVAILAVELLKAFINQEQFTHAQLAWKVGIHFTFVLSGVLCAVTDRIADGKSGGH